MNIVFVSNYFNHHQMELAKNLLDLCDNYYFISTVQITEERKNMGWGREKVPDYVIDYNNNRELCQKIVDDLDVVIYGSAPYSIIKDRLKNGKIVFFYSERLFKNVKIDLKTIKQTAKMWAKFHRYNNAYLLCASAFAAHDYYMINCFRKRYIKWGYFPPTRTYDDIETVINCKTPHSILWVSRLIEWKHPEVCIELGKALKKRNIDFTITMIGVGPLRDDIQKLIKSNQLDDNISLLGSMSPTEVRDYMEKSELFVFTSDQNEGWGAVLNESMNSAMNSCTQSRTRSASARKTER